METEEGPEALHGAHALARSLHARLRVLPDGDAQERGETERRVQDAVPALGAGASAVVEVVVGDPGDMLVAASRELDVLVCGWRGYGPVRVLLLGSVSHRVANEAHCPIVVLPRGVKRSLEALVAQAPGAAAPA